MVKNILFLIIFLFPTSYSSELEPHQISDEDLSAIENFVSTMIEQLKIERHKAKEEHLAKYLKHQNLLKNTELKFLAEQQDNLQESINRYEKQLAQHPHSEMRPYTIFNLAKAFDELGDISQETADQSRIYYQQATELLKSLIREKVSFRDFDAAVYYLGSLYKKIGKKRDAIVTWKQAIKSDKSSFYNIKSSMALGDHYFRSEKPLPAQEAYTAAQDMMENSDLEDAHHLRLDLLYRLVWSAYRNADSETALRHSKNLFAQFAKLGQDPRFHSMSTEIAQVVGNIMYESANSRQIKQLLANPPFIRFAGTIGKRILSQYSGQGLYAKTAELGQHFMRSFPLSQEMPEIAVLTMHALKRLNKTDSLVSTAETLALALPQQSLWRSKYKQNHQRIKTMAEMAEKAAILVASHHYEKGLASGSTNAFRSAASYFDLLLESRPTHPQIPKWQLRRANSFYFINKFKLAETAYKDIIREGRDEEITEVASYQLVRCLEKQWRFELRKSIELRGSKALPKQKAFKLERAINDYTSRYPQRGRSADLLVLGAAVFRDINEKEKASQMWQRVLAGDATPHQRAVAVRGILATRLEKDSAAQVLQTARQFIQLEDWQKLGISLDHEIKGVISQAATEEGQRLYKDGDIAIAAKLLVELAGQYKDLPLRAKLFRDGAYMYAISGNWYKALQTVEVFLSLPLNQYRGDMMYLGARSLEFQLRFQQAAEYYLKLAKQFPRHSRAKRGVARGENLALADGDELLAARCAEELANFYKGSKSIKALGRAAEHFIKYENFRLAQKVARRRLLLSKTTAEKLTSRLLMAKIFFHQGKEKTALQEWQQVGSSAKRLKHKIEKNEYAYIIGEAFFNLGLEAEATFTNYKIMERRGSLAEKVRQKSVLFERLVRAYDTVANANHHKWAPQSRFRLAQAAEQFADEISGLPNRLGDKLNRKVFMRYEDNIKRLRDINKRYLAKNIMEKRNNPGQYKNNIWINKSTMQLTGSAETTPTLTSFGLEYSFPYPQPMSWSL